MNNPSGKDTIYIDIDDEITAIIDKVRGSHERIVALVLPKRATVLQSIVNMKLLKRTADEAKKHLVLITGEAGLLPLAGSVGIYVAKSLQSKPEIPATHMSQHDADDDAEEAVSMADADKLDATRPVAEHLKKAPASAVLPPADDEDVPIELDNTESATPLAADTKKSPKKSKKFNIPDFNKFRMLAAIGGAALLLIVFLSYMAFSVMPRATVAIKTDSSAIQDSLDITLDTEASEVDVTDALVPATVQQTQKTAAQTVDATGQKDKGQKASGAITASTPCTSDAPSSVSAGTAVSSNGLTYITQQTISFAPQIKSGKCQFVGSTDVTAQLGGDKYNAAAKTDYKIAGRNELAVSGSEMAGGTTEVVKIVSQTDIDNAKQKIASQETVAVKQELMQGLTAKALFAIDSTFTANEPEVTTNVKVGDEAPSVIVTQKTTYTLLGVQQNDLKKIIANVVNGKIDPKKQQILDHGIDGATFKVQNQQKTSALVTMSFTAVAGSDINITDIKKQIAGKKSSDAKEVITQYPGVTEVKVDYSPFWVSSIPKKTSKITVTVEKPAVKNAR